MNELLQVYEELHHPDHPVVLCPLQWMGDGTVAKGVLRFETKISADWVLEVYRQTGPFDGIYHLLTGVGSPLVPTAVHIDTTSPHNSRSCGFLAAEVAPADAQPPGHMTHFVVDPVYVNGISVNKFAIRVP